MPNYLFFSLARSLASLKLYPTHFDTVCNSNNLTLLIYSTMMARRSIKPPYPYYGQRAKLRKLAIRLWKRMPSLSEKWSQFQQTRNGRKTGEAILALLVILKDVEKKEEEEEAD